MIRHRRLKAAAVEVFKFLTAALAADRNIDYSRENRFRALMPRSQGPRANIQLQCHGFSTISIQRPAVLILRCKEKR